MVAKHVQVLSLSYLAKQGSIHGKPERRFVRMVHQSRNVNGLVKCPVMARWHERLHEVSGHEFR